MHIYVDDLVVWGLSGGWIRYTIIFNGIQFFLPFFLFSFSCHLIPLGGKYCAVENQYKEFSQLPVMGKY